MLKLKNILKAVQAFIYINHAEEVGIEYIDRLAKAAQICEDEPTWTLFTNLFNNEDLCRIYINYMETAQN